MDPSKVKLPLITKLKIVKQTMDAHEDIYAIVFSSLFLIPGWLLAMQIPSFMLGPISNFIMTFFFTITFSLIIIAITIGVTKLYQDDFYPFLCKMKATYNEKALPFQEAELEKVDDILLDNK